MHLVRHADLRSALDPQRHLVKLSEQFLWKSPAPAGLMPWKPGTEIHSESLAISLFEPGAEQKPHYHEGTWEMYQVLEGALRIAVNQGDGGWRCVRLERLDMLLVRPGTPHLVEAGGDHLTQVIQSPPAGCDQTIVEDAETVGAACRALEACKER